jgi:hypothetical protein
VDSFTVGLGGDSEDGNGGCARVLSEDGHFVGVAAKVFDVLLHPLEDSDLESI